MKDNELMLSLLRRLKVEMNGAVSANMAERGVVYGLNYGVSIPTIQDITKPYFPNHSLASLLYKQDIRELKLAALFIDDPREVSREQMLLWGESIVNSELAEQTVLQLFSKADSASEVAVQWIESCSPLLCYAGLLMAARVFVLYGEDSDVSNKVVDSSIVALQTWLGHAQFKLISRAVTQLLCKGARLPRLHEKIKNTIITLSVSVELPLRQVGDEADALINIAIA